MRIFPLFLFVAAISCGKSSLGGSPDAAKEAAPNPKDQLSSMLVADAGKLPECNEEREGALAYVKAESLFTVCTAGVWETIDIRGEKGEPGAKGDKGDVGAKEEGAVTDELPPLAWRDPFTLKIWLFTGSGTWDIAQQVCKNGWSLPAPAALTEAARNGLAAFCANMSCSGFGTAWTTEESVDQLSGTYVTLSTNPSTTSDGKGSVRGVICSK